MIEVVSGMSLRIVSAAKTGKIALFSVLSCRQVGLWPQDCSHSCFWNMCILGWGECRVGRERVCVSHKAKSSCCRVQMLVSFLQLPSVPKSSDGLLLVLLFSPGVWGPMICSHFLRGSYR